MAQEKYWMFDGKDAVGPFYSDELKRQPLFGPETLICPDGSEDANLWRAAKYYLIKPPGRAPEPARPPEPQPQPEPQPEPLSVLPSVAPAAKSAPARAPFPVKNAAMAAAAILVPTLAYFAMRKTQKPVPSVAPAAPMTVSAPQAAPAPAEVNQEAVDFVLKFPTISAGNKLPGSADDIFSAPRWKAPESVGEGLEMKSFYVLGQSAGQTLQKQGHGPQAGEAELRRNREHWDAYAQRFFKANYRLNWNTELVVAGGTRYRVTGEASYHRDGPRDIHAFEADLEKRTLKPLNLDAWYDIDPKGCADWADKNVRLGEPVDEGQLAAAAPSYTYPLPKRGQHKKKPSDMPLAAAEKKKKSPAMKPAPLAPPGEESDYPDEGAQDNPLVKATSDEPARPAPKPQAAPASKPASSTAKLPGSGPMPDKNASQPVANSDNKSADAAPGKAKDATDMSVDELEKYLNRGADAKN